ncbi:GDSL esterase/lipase At5g55050-like [Triticum dicoccoides]|uniref:GDSL esterase/lipase At5g55050-like n=1 Tax=Triticum dicoccoides TaxID=85692 RepID=UPI001890934B|nr:GDSL esterase/lipase At5g55050-like [Triticum dicoccoides]
MAGRGGAFALVALCMLELALLHGAGAGAGERLVPAMFVFGDSTVDVGNNNLLPVCKPECRANYPQYGVDHPSHAPTGRFSNGYNLADQIAKLLGFNESPPAFLSLQAEGIIPRMNDGINFASGGSGLQNQTGEHCGGVYSMADQLEEFTLVVKMMGNSSYDLISRSLFFISVGSNDLFEYAHAKNPPPNRNDTAFLKCLVDSYKTYLQELHALGARKFSIVSPSLVGCCPSQRAAALQHHNDFDELHCFRPANNLSKQLYALLASKLQELGGDLDGMHYSICDSAGMAEMVFTPGGAKDPTVVDTACCAGPGPFGVGLCNTSATLCPNRTNFVFWDSFHPTEYASGLAASALFIDNGKFVRPINVGQLAAL